MNQEKEVGASLETGFGSDIDSYIQDYLSKEEGKDEPVKSEDGAPDVPGMPEKVKGQDQAQARKARRRDAGRDGAAAGLPKRQVLFYSDARTATMLKMHCSMNNITISAYIVNVLRSALKRDMDRDLVKAIEKSPGS